jgi:hypothetical protein
LPDFAEVSPVDLGGMFGKTTFTFSKIRESPGAGLTGTTFAIGVSAPRSVVAVERKGSA